MTKVVNGKVMPLWHSLNPSDQNAVQSLLKRLAGDGNQEAVIDELMLFIDAGFANFDFANRVRV